MRNNFYKSSLDNRKFKIYKSFFTIPKIQEVTQALITKQTDRKHIEAEIHQNRHEYIIDYKDLEYKVWSNTDGDEIVSNRFFELPDWVKDQLSDIELGKLKTGEMVELKVPFDQIKYEIRERETGKMVKQPSIEQLWNGTYNHFRGEGGEIIEDDHPDSPLRKMGLI